MKQHKINKEQFRELVVDYRSHLNNHRPVTAFLTKPQGFPIPDLVWEEWRRVILQNLRELSKSKNLNDLHERIDDLRIPKIGPKSIYETTKDVAYECDIHPDDSCWMLIVEKTPIVRFLGISAEDIKDYFERLSPDFAELTSEQKIDFIIGCRCKIKGFIKKQGELY